MKSESDATTQNQIAGPSEVNAEQEFELRKIQLNQDFELKKLKLSQDFELEKQKLSQTFETEKLGRDSVYKMFDLSANLAEKATDKGITVATAFLGGTLVFAEKIAGAYHLVYILILIIGILAVVASVGLLLYVRSKNIDAIKKALANKPAESAKASDEAEGASDAARFVLFMGMLTIVFFMILTLYDINEKKKDKTSMSNEKVTQPIVTEIRKDEGIRPADVMHILFPANGNPGNPSPQSGGTQTTSTPDK